MADAKLKLTYFNTKGLAEGIRFILAYSETNFEDNRIVKADWPAIKEKLDYGTLPILEVEGKTINQSLAIARFVGRRAGLVPKDLVTEALLDAVLDNVKDTIAKLHQAHGSNKSPETEKAAAESMKILLDRFEKITGSGYFYGSVAPTWVDIYFAGFMETMKCYRPALLDHHPNVKKLVENVISNENIVKYIKQKPVEDPISV